MTREQAIEQLKKVKQYDDSEKIRSYSNRVLCALLKQLGYADVVAEWEKVEKWYA